MCIRDRGWVERYYGTDRYAASADIAKQSFAPGVSVAYVAYGPVSYTHLRAHETVLDLVCRLLLEKKKERKKMKAQSIHYTH